MTSHLPPHCPYCNVPATLKDSGQIFGRSYGCVWHCGSCEARVGCHPGTTEPLGTLANAELRKARVAAHREFDPLWRSGRWRRQNCYAWLAGKLGIAVNDCHIARFDVEQCRQVVEAVEWLLGKWPEKV